MPFYAISDLEEAEVRRVGIVVEGVPSYVSVVSGADTVAVRKRIEL